MEIIFWHMFQQLIVKPIFRLLAIIKEHFVTDVVKTGNKIQKP